jgi:type I restriction enzyme S subunit
MTIIGRVHRLLPFTHPLILAHLLSISDSLVANCRGATIQGLTREFVHSLEIPLPPLAEQKRIAAVLDQHMAAVERARAATLAQLEAAKALPAAYLRAVFNSPEAQHWPIKKLGEVGDIVSGITLGRKIGYAHTRSVPYLRVANVKDAYLDLSDVYQIEATEAEIEKLRLKFGDLLLTEGGDPDKLGRGTFWEDQILECIHQNHIFRVRFDEKNVLPQFVSAQIGSPYGKAYFLAHAKQTTGIATINQKVLAGFPLMAPPLAEQQQVVGHLKEQLAAAEKARKALENQLAAIDALPAALLRRAFSGEL